MRGVLVENPGKEARLVLRELPDPSPGPGEILIETVAAALNRGDLAQRAGHYPPPPGASEVLGLECAGRVLECGAGVAGFAPGDRVMALLPGGGYATRAVAHAGSVMHVPEGMPWHEAGAFPEVFLTVFLTVFELGALPEGGRLLAHGGGGGIGTAAIQLAKAAGARVIVTAGSDEKCARCLALGADRAVNYRDASFVDAVKDATDGRGVDVVLDHVAASYLDQNLKCLATGGRLVIIGLLGGARAELNLGSLLMKRLQVIGSTLRARPPQEKAALVEAFLARFGADLDAGRLRPVLDRTLPLEEVEAAHALMEASDHFGKIVLSMS